MRVRCVTYYGQIRTVSYMEPSLGSADQADIQGWGMSPRGAGFLFGSDVVDVSTACKDKSIATATS